MEATGIPPRYRDLTEAKVESGPPPPPRSVDRQVWEETDKILDELQHGPVDMQAQYGTPDLEPEGPADREWLNHGS